MLYVGSTPFDDLFEPRTATKVADTGWLINGVDIANRYERLSSGARIASNTGYVVDFGSWYDERDGTWKNGEFDLRDLFCAKGTVSSWGGTVQSLPTSVFGTGGFGYTNGFAAIRLTSTGNIETEESGTVTQRGSWAQGGANSSNTQCRFVVTGSPSPGTVSNNATSWIALNINRVVSLTNTSSSNQAYVSVSVQIRDLNNTSTTNTKSVDLYAIADPFGGGGIS